MEMEIQTKYCEHCGTKISESSNYCPRCGHKIRGSRNLYFSTLQEYIKNHKNISLTYIIYALIILCISLGVIFSSRSSEDRGLAIVFFIIFSIIIPLCIYLGYNIYMNKKYKDQKVETSLYEETHEETVLKPKEKEIPKQTVWSLIEFAREHGRLQVPTIVNKETGEETKVCKFTSPSGNVVIVNFSTDLGELTLQEIIEMKHSLDVVLDSTNHYVLSNKISVDLNDFKEEIPF